MNEPAKVGETLGHVQVRSALRLARASEALAFKDRQLRKLKDRLESELACIDEIERRDMTPYVALFERDGLGFKCIGVFNPDTDDNIPEEWVLCIPIPNPENLPEFEGF